MRIILNSRATFFDTTVLFKKFLKRAVECPVRDTGTGYRYLFKTNIIFFFVRMHKFRNIACLNDVTSFWDLDPHSKIRVRIEKMFQELKHWI
jgi:hypothetical protein